MTPSDMLTSNSPDRPSANSYWVVPGRFVAGEYPGAWDPVAQAATRLKTLLDTGIDQFIDLTEPGELSPLLRNCATASPSASAWHYSGGSGIRSSTRAFRGALNRWAAILDAIDDALGNNKVRLCPLLGWSGTDRHSRWLLAGAAWPHGRRSPPPDCRLVAGG